MNVDIEIIPTNNSKWKQTTNKETVTLPDTTTNDPLGFCEGSKYCAHGSDLSLPDLFLQITFNESLGVARCESLAVHGYSVMRHLGSVVFVI